MIAVIKTGGKQYTVKEGDVFNVEKINAEVGAKHTISDVLLVSGEDNFTVGNPALDKASVEVEIVEHGRGKKVINFKRKRRKDYRRVIGHRQAYTRVKVTAINAG